MNHDAPIRHSVILALAVGASGSLVAAISAFGQTAPSASTTARIKLSEITVIGTHIPETAIAKSQPVITLNRQQIDSTGFTTVGELLQNLSSAGPSLNVQINNGGNGMQLINLHNLGPQRVLVLVNGQRWIPTLFGAVDLTTIPLSIVERVEVLLDGASAVYGSEAIAGVINIITIKNYDGAQANAYYGGYDARGDGGGWDGKTQKYNFTVGAFNRRSSVLLAAGYYQQLPVWMGQRTISKEPIVGFGNQLGSDGSLGGRFVVLNGPGGQLVNGCQPSFCDVSGPDPYDPSGFHQWSAADRYNYAPANYLRTPQERWHIYSQGHYDLNDNVTFSFMTTYQRRNSAQVLAPNPWFFGYYGGETQNEMPIGISSNAPNNPFGVDLVPFYPSSTGFSKWCSLYGSPNCMSQFDILLYYGRRPVEAGNRVFKENNDTFYFNGGFTGYYDALGTEWNWNAHYVYGQTLETDITTGVANTARLQDALSYGCASDPSCVPLDVFGGAGTITPAMAEYVLFTAHNVNKTVVRDYNANINGDVFKTWYAGPWGVAAGYEYEQFDGFSSPDPLVSTGNTTTNATQPTEGRVNTNAQYLELNIPFAYRAPLARELSLNLAERWSQFHWSGTGNLYDPIKVAITTGSADEYAHAAVPRATLRWKPVDTLLLRATWAEGFRTPSLSELFFGASEGFQGAKDPCALPAPQPLPPGCPSRHIQQNGQIGTTEGGNVGLEPEKAITRSAGFVYSPGFVPGLNISADYYKAEITSVIAAPGAQFWIDSCYLNQDPQACKHIVVTGPVITNVIDLNVNLGRSKVEGWDIDGRYRLPATPVGNFTLRLSMNFSKTVQNCLSTGLCVDNSGHFTIPKHRYDFSANWNYGPWTATWRIRLIGPKWEYCQYSPANGRGPTPSAPPTFGWCSKIFDYYDANGNITTDQSQAVAIANGLNHLGTTVYNDIQASYTVSAWNTTFTLGANNVFDKQPPISMEQGTYLPVMYDTPGRFVYGRISVAF